MVVAALPELGPVTTNESILNVDVRPLVLGDPMLQKNATVCLLDGSRPV